MKNSIIAVLTLGTCILSIGCASTETASNDYSASASGTEIASSEQLDADLPAVAAPPSTSSWGGGSLLY